MCITWLKTNWIIPIVHLTLFNLDSCLDHFWLLWVMGCSLKIWKKIPISVKNEYKSCSSDCLSVWAPNNDSKNIHFIFIYELQIHDIYHIHVSVVYFNFNSPLFPSISNWSGLYRNVRCKSGRCASPTSLQLFQPKFRLTRFLFPYVKAMLSRLSTHKKSGRHTTVATLLLSAAHPQLHISSNW